MTPATTNTKFYFLRKLTACATAVIFLIQAVLPGMVYAQGFSSLNLPAPGTMLQPSPAFVPVLIKGMTVDPQDPLHFDFIVDSGHASDTPEAVKEESQKLIKYFLASLAIPDNDMWVNLSPYEKERIIPDALGKTDLGRDMLAQDYLLKQLTASLMHPEKDLGKSFWNRVYKLAQEKFGTTDIPIDTFNKVWILPEKAAVYERNSTVYIVESRLKVMLEEDYEALRQNMKSAESQAIDSNGRGISTNKSLMSQEQKTLVRELIIPELEREVNEGKNFAALRQIYHSLILAKWYKETVQDSFLSFAYQDQNLVQGIDIKDPAIKEKIYRQYVEAYKKGIFNYIKEDFDATAEEMVPRKYFAGGLLYNNLQVTRGSVSRPGAVGRIYQEDVRIGGDRAMLSKQPEKVPTPELTAEERVKLTAEGRLIRSEDEAALDSVADRLAWFAIAMIDHANREDYGLKTGGHQSATLSSLHLIMAMELFARRGHDHVGHKPHSGPSFYALQALLGYIPKEWLSWLRDTAITPEENAQVQNMLSQMTAEELARFTAMREDLRAQLHSSALSDLDRPGLAPYPSTLDGVTKFPTGTVGMTHSGTIGVAGQNNNLRSQGVDVLDGRYYAVIGDAEIAEGYGWEMIVRARQLGVTNATIIVDINRKSLDGDIAGSQAINIRGIFEPNDWHVIELLWGRRIQKLFDDKANGGAIFQRVMESLDPEEYEKLSSKPGKEIKEYLITAAKKFSDTPDAGEVLQKLLDSITDNDYFKHKVYLDLGGHDLVLLTEALAKAQKVNKPVAVLAHTVKGWGVDALIGKPGNHSELIPAEALEAQRKKWNVPEGDWKAFFEEGTPEQQLLDRVKARYEAEKAVYDQKRAALAEREQGLRMEDLPRRVNPGVAGTDIFTQHFAGLMAAKFIRIQKTPFEKLQAAVQDAQSKLENPGTSDPADLRKKLTAAQEDLAWKPVADMVEFLSPDVGSSTGLPSTMTGNVVGPEQTDFHQELGLGLDPKIVNTTPSPAGTFHRLLIAESAAVSEAAAVGKSHEFFGTTRIAVMSVYDMFLRVCENQIFYAAYWGSKMLIRATPGGRLAPEGAQHQKYNVHTIPNVITFEAFSEVEVDLLEADFYRRAATNNDKGRNVGIIRLATIAMKRNEFFNRLKEQPAYQGLTNEQIVEKVSSDILAGGYRLVDHSHRPDYDPAGNVVTIVANGQMVTEALAASDAALKQGIYANVIVVNSDRLLWGDIGKATNFAHLKKLIPEAERSGAAFVSVTDVNSDYLAPVGQIGLAQGIVALGADKIGRPTRSVHKLDQHQGNGRVAIGDAILAASAKRLRNLQAPGAAAGAKRRVQLIPQRSLEVLARETAKLIEAKLYEGLEPQNFSIAGVREIQAANLAAEISQAILEYPGTLEALANNLHQRILGADGAEQFEYAQAVQSPEALTKIADEVKGLLTVENDKAMLSDVGGIDMNDITIERADQEKRIQFDPTVMLKYTTINPETFVPVIINIVPVPSLIPLLGLDENSAPVVQKISSAK